MPRFYEIYIKIGGLKRGWTAEKLEAVDLTLEKLGEIFTVFRMIRDKFHPALLEKDETLVITIREKQE